MRNFDDLNDAEILALDDAQVNQYIDLACAEAGVALLPPPPNDPALVPVTPDVTVYGVGDFYFYEQGDALQVATLLGSLRRCTAQYVSGPRYERVIRPDNNDPTVSTAKHFSPENWDRVKNDANRYAEQKKTYDTNLAEYNKASEARSRIAEAICERRERVCADEHRRNQLHANFERYLTLADGNRGIAACFLQNAHGDASALLPELFPAASTSND